MTLLSSTSGFLTDALTEHDSEHGLTVLGQAVAWGHEKSVEMLARACRYKAFCTSLLLLAPCIVKVFLQHF